MVRFQVALLAVCATAAAAVDIVVHEKGGTKIRAPYGLMHEDINNAGDGGIYAELIRNRAFQGSDLYPVSLSGWSPINGATLSIKNLTEPLSSALPSSMNVAVENATRSKSVGFANSGFWGMDVRKQQYTGSFYVKGDYKGVFTAGFKSALTNDTFGHVQIKSKAKKNKWVQHHFTLVPERNAPNSNNTFTLTFDPSGVREGSLDFNLISLFPPTYKGRENGLRKDLAEVFEALNPKWLRFPGGNALEGPDLANPWKWNETLGPLKDRPGRPGVWGYQTSDGMGLMEYLYWAEDMNLEPILGVWAGLALDGGYLSEEELKPWVEDALNEIEFIRGDPSTPYGKLRASLGHPKPWKLKYVEIGNEDWLAGRPLAYEAYKNYRFPMFKKAIEEKYPDIQIIASPSVFDNMTIPLPAAGDYHPYEEPDDFYHDFHQFANLTKDNLTIVGEFASVHPNGGIKWDGGLHPYPWWIGSVAEAIFMISTEIYGDRIIGSTYAPIMRNMNSWSWSACLVQFEADVRKTTLSTSYHVFKLIANSVITHTQPTTPKSNTTSLFWVAGRNDDGSRIVKLANYNTTNHEDTDVSVKFEGLSLKEATLTLLRGTKGPYGVHEDADDKAFAEEKKVLKANKAGAFNFVMPELSVAVLESGKRRPGGRD